MPRMKWWLLQSLVLYIYQTQPVFAKCNVHQCANAAVDIVKCCMDKTDTFLENQPAYELIKIVRNLESTLENADITKTESISSRYLVAALHKPKHKFTGFQIYANESKAAVENNTVPNTKVRVRLPGELGVSPHNTIVFCMITWPERNETVFGVGAEVYERRLVGLSVKKKTISNLQERVNITMDLTASIKETQELVCAYFNFSSENFSSDGCETQWKRGQSSITCSCNHLTYFGVLMVTADLSQTDQKILSYISQIGCSLSLCALVVTLFIFCTNRHARADTSLKVHVNLVIALILLNIHLIPSDMLASLPSPGLCLYLALALHYSLLAVFSWMGLEGFHIYLLLVRVFNIYVRRYVLKLCLVGWGVPVVIVSLVVIIDRDAYNRVFLDSSKSTSICYIADDTVKMVTTVGVFCLIFITNIGLFGVTVKRVVSLKHRSGAQFGQSECDRARKDICTLLGVITLLGLTWGLIFFSFGHLTTPGLYLFCILNSLQGVFIFLWFVMSLRKNKNSTAKTSSETRSTNN